MRAFSFERLFAVLVKEFIQMRRDRLTAAMVLGIPVLQLMLFGFAGFEAHEGVSLVHRMRSGDVDGVDVGIARQSFITAV